MTDDSTTTVLLRVCLADRPGALGAVMRRISAVKGDLMAIDILEQVSGVAIDELVIALPDPGLVDIMMAEVDEEDDVEVLEVTPLQETLYRPQFDPFDLAALIAGSPDPSKLFECLCVLSRRAIRSDWACIADSDKTVVASHGTVPDNRWLADFIDGSLGPTGSAVWMPLPNAGLSLVVGRTGSPYRAKERHRIAALARITDSVHSHLQVKNQINSLLRHPSVGET